MQNGTKVGAYLLGAISLVILGFLSSTASANRFASPSFTIDASVGNSFGGRSDSANYGLVSSGGEAVIGNGASGSYKMGQGYVAQLEQSMQLTVQPHGLVAYYPFETASGNRVYDNSANSIDASTSTGVIGEAGKLGQGLSFNGTSNVNLGDVNQLKMTGNQTISLWIKPGDTSVRRSIYAKAYGGEGTIVQEIDRKLRYMYGTSGGNATPFQFIETNVAVPIGDWTHIAIVRNLDNMTLTWYINGVQDVQVAANYSAATASTLPAVIGGGYVNNYQGQLDEFKIFARALNASDIKADYEAMVAGRSSGLSLNDIIPGTSQSNSMEAVVQTDGPSYGVAMSQNTNLTNGSQSIPAISPGSIATPAAWNEGNTKGLGFTLTSGLALPGKWGSNPNYYYAAIPATSTTFYNRSGYSGGVKDSLAIRYRLDIPADQASGNYSNIVTYGATIIP